MRQLYKVEGKPRQEDAGEVSGLLFELVSYKQQLIAISADKHIPTPCPLQCADKNDVELQVLAAWVMQVILVRGLWTCVIFNVVTVCVYVCV